MLMYLCDVHYIEGITWLENPYGGSLFHTNNYSNLLLFFYVFNTSLLFDMLDTAGRCIHCLERIHNSRGVKVSKYISLIRPLLNWCLSRIESFAVFISNSHLFCLHRYYYNEVTKQSKWTIPDELKVFTMTLFSLSRLMHFWSVNFL